MIHRTLGRQSAIVASRNFIKKMVTFLGFPSWDVGSYECMPYQVVYVLSRAVSTATIFNRPTRVRSCMADVSWHQRQKDVVWHRVRLRPAMILMRRGSILGSHVGDMYDKCGNKLFATTYDIMRKISCSNIVELVEGFEEYDPAMRREFETLFFLAYHARLCVVVDFSLYSMLKSFFFQFDVQIIIADPLTRHRPPDLVRATMKHESKALGVRFTDDYSQVFQMSLSSNTFGQL